MSNEPELKARDKVVVRMTREGAVEENLTAGTEQRVSKRLEDAELVKPAETAAPSEALSPEEQKKVQMRRQQRQFQTDRQVLYLCPQLGISVDIDMVDHLVFGFHMTVRTFDHHNSGSSPCVCPIKFYYNTFI